MRPIRLRITVTVNGLGFDVGGGDVLGLGVAVCRVGDRTFVDVILGVCRNRPPWRPRPQPHHWYPERWDQRHAHPCHRGSQAEQGVDSDAFGHAEESSASTRPL